MKIIKRPLTRAHNKFLDEAAEIQLDRASAKDAAFLARQFIQATLPHRDPKAATWTRKNGNFALGLQAGFNHLTGETYGLPYGVIPRLLLFWITTEALRTKHRRLELGDSLAQFMREVGLSPDTGGGKRSDAKRLQEQMRARQISLALGVPPQRSFQRQMEGLERMMADAYIAGRNVVVLLDDAQLMDSEALEVVHRLYNFDYDAKVVQILSFGQSEMTGLYETNRAVNARVFVRLVLPPLTLGSALQMVLFRLRVAGRNDPLIHDDAFELLYERSRGVPREIIRLCALATDSLLQSEETMINLDIAREAR